jgi:hypothetical protein
MTVKLLNIAALFMGFVSAVLLSLGVLTPEIVRNLGQALANRILTKPKNSFLEAAYYKVVPFDKEKEDLKDWLNRCVIDLTVSLLTVVIATLITFFFVFGLSLWALISGLKHPSSNRLQIALSLIGFFICICGVVSFLPNKPKKTAPGWSVVRQVIRQAGNVASLLQPAVFIVDKCVSVFTKNMPLLWYRSLKSIQARGINWLFTLIGFLLFMVSTGLQLWAILVAP